MKQFFERLCNPQRFTPYAVIMSLIALALIFVPALRPIQHPGIVVIALFSAIAITYLEDRKRRNEEAARLVDTLNGNLLRTIEALTAIREIKADLAVWEALPTRHRNRLLLAEDRLGNLAAKVQGFRQFAELRDRILGGDEDR